MGTTVMQPVLAELRERTGEAVSLGVRVGDEVAVLVRIPLTVGPATRTTPIAAN